jgi:hypothetical protein
MTPRILIGLASLLIAALLLFLFLPRNKGPFRAMPAQSSLVLECRGLFRAKVLNEKTADPRWREVLQSTLFQRCFEDMDAALQLFRQQPSLLRTFAQNKALVAFTLHPSDSLHALFALELGEDFDLESSLRDNKQIPKYFPHQFHGNNIFTVHISGTGQLEVAVSGRLLLFSRRATLVEDALLQLENAHNWWADRPFVADLPDAPLCVHLRPATLAEQWRNQMDPRWRELPDLLARNLEWVGLSWDGKSLQALAESKGFLGNLAGMKKASSDAIFNVLPDNTAFLVRSDLGNRADFFRHLSDARSSEFEEYVLPWVGEEAALAVTEPLSQAFTDDRLLLLAVRDSAKAVDKLRAFSKACGAIPGVTGPYQMFELLGFQNASLLRPLLGEDAAFRNPVCALVGGYAVFAPDRSALEILLDKYLVNQTLSTHLDFLQLQQKMSSNGRVSLLLNTGYLPALLQHLIHTQGEPSFAKTGFIAAEWHPISGRKAEITLASQVLSQPLPETDILWKSVFAKPIQGRPYLISPTADKSYVLIQDQGNNLHCLDALNGAGLWNRSLPDRILSDIRGVDFYGYGAGCYTFSTATRIYMLDENGRDIQGFPLKLPANASNGAITVDFEGNAKFSYFVACEKNKLYGFGHLGRPLEGWNGLETSGVVKQPVLHFQHQGKDYLAVLTEDGLLSVFGRDGTLRFAPIQLDGAAKFVSLMQADADSKTPHIYCANAAGKRFACDLQGKVSVLQAGNPGSATAFGPLKGEAYAWAVLDGKKLRVGDWGTRTNTGLFSHQFPEKQSQVFFVKNGQIGTVDSVSRQVWLLDSKGNTHAGFPLGGNTRFELGSINGVDMLVVGNINGVWAYRLR